MALDMHQTVPGIEGMTQAIVGAGDLRQRRLDAALRLLHDPLSGGASITEDTLRQRVEAAGLPWPRAHWPVATFPVGQEPLPELSRCYDAPATLDEYVAVAVDGSQIPPDRHGPAHCFLINIGGACIRYGPRATADLFSTPHLFSKPDELFITDTGSDVRQQPIEEVLLGVKRMVMECQRLADRLEAMTLDAPVLALLDGSLVLWSLARGRYGDRVHQVLLRDGFLAALDRIREVARRGKIAFASYISYPRSAEVVNLLRVARCPHEDVLTSGCNKVCTDGGPGKQECNDVAEGLMDRDLFEALLEPGQRSAVFRSQSSILSDYGDHRVRFCYVNVGEEIARLEMPEWVADDPQTVDLLHGLVLEQCRKGRGYPLALQEAHEQAVVTAGDQRQFWHLVERSLMSRGLAPMSSEKAMSKRQRAL